MSCRYVMQQCLPLARFICLPLCLLSFLSSSFIVVKAADVTQRGGSGLRNNVSTETGAPTVWDVDAKEGVKWSRELGSITYGGPVVADGQVYVATNNDAAYLEKYPNNIDMGCLLCFSEETGDFLWQLSRPKLEAGDDYDWAHQGICSDPYVEENRLWIVTNRCEVLCLDTAGFSDQKNDGSVTDEVDQDIQSADIIWQLDMLNDLGVQPRNMTTCSITGAGDLIFVSTSNGVADVDSVTEENPVPAPEAPSFLAINKTTGKIVWSDNRPGPNLLQGVWSSPAYAVIDGRAQVIFAAGDGYCYGFDPAGDGDGNSRLLWKFDCNPKSSVWDPFDQEGRNNLIATPVVHDGIVYIAVGQDPEIGDGPGCLWAISPNKQGDVSPTLVVDKNNKPVPPRRIQALDEDAGEKEVPNPNSALVWKYTGEDRDGSGSVDLEEEMSRAIASVTIQDDILVIGCFSGVVHCLDSKTGKPHWSYDMFAHLWGAALIVEDKIYLGDEDGDLAIFELSIDPEVAMAEGEPHEEISMGAAIYTSPVFANGTLYISTANTLFALEK
ncbi:outer membrane biogenesis protein BamB [Polystyrenella longa]|uniref:Outer membrane biogenesis protein BamB n=1 Tax=Polystyrenella longa TaxID=2528007 RepID=A0A518CI54_9PLAN|nr:PQQ-binding-like beta-propeller repeat protein [Polystyrenella longa]QDU78905.1 outer membrane biogenesis protein BamB [Polystyrenella longa]